MNIGSIGNIGNTAGSGRADHLDIAAITGIAGKGDIADTPDIADITGNRGRGRAEAAAGSGGMNIGSIGNTGNTAVILACPCDPIMLLFPHRAAASPRRLPETLPQMKHTIRFLAVALCLLFARDVGARTLYVDDRRPNNNGNGYSLRKAKKTIQAAVNIAKKGDTIIVYPGTYYPGDTNNKKIKIKTKAGSAKTVIRSCNHLRFGNKFKNYRGTNTTLSGFSMELCRDGTLLGGTLASCVFLGDYQPTMGCSWNMENTRLNRCKSYFMGLFYISESKLSNCLFANAHRLSLTYSTVINCTIADNNEVELAFVKAYNTLFHKVLASQFKSSQHNKLKNCYKGANPGFVRPATWKTKTVEVSYWDDYNSAKWDDSIGDYRYYATTTIFTPGDYRLKKGSPCINKGKLTAAQKKLVGTKDLAGKKRVRGRSVDIGCYEY